jgi:hypothetical protein
VLKSIEEQGKLTPELRAAIEAAPTKQELEDLYLPYKPKRRTKGMIAREAGLEPLADAVRRPDARPAGRGAGLRQCRRRLCRRHAVLDGVRDLLSERWAEDAALVGKLREWLWAEGLFRSKLLDGKDGKHPDAAKFRDYFDYAEPIRTVPSHRALAVFRGRTLECWMPSWCSTKSSCPGQPTLAEGRIAVHLGWSHAKRPGDDLIRKTIAWTWKVKLSLSLERDLFSRLREDPPRRWPSRCSPTTCATCCSPHRPAARRDGPGPGHPHRRARWPWSRHRQGAGHPPSTRTSRARLGRLAAHPGPAGGHAWREPDRHRQRHRQPRDRQAGRRPDQALHRSPPTRRSRRWWSAKPAPRSTAPANTPARSCRSST